MMRENNLEFFTIERSEDKLMKHKLKYDEKRRLYKSSHSVFNYSFLLLFRTEKETDNKELKDSLNRFLLEHKDVLEAKYFYHKSILGIAFSAPPTLDRMELMQDFEEFLLKYDYIDGMMNSIGNLDEESIKELIWEIF